VEDDLIPHPGVHHRDDDRLAVRGDPDVGDPPGVQHGVDGCFIIPPALGEAF
jgi:hypothetical protein